MPTADLLMVKLMFNSVISMPNAKFMTIDIKDFYLMTPMEQYEHFRMKLEVFPPDIIEEYWTPQQGGHRWKRFL
jgi:hypothetical protein